MGTEIKDIIFQRRQELNLSQLQIADYVGVSEATVSRWESGYIENMKISRVKKLAEILQLSPLVFLDGQLDRRVMVEDVACLPVIGSVTAGPGGVAEPEYLGSEPLIGYPDLNELRLLLVKGDSMAPNIQDGDIAIVRVQSSVDNGDIAVVIVDGEEGCIKRINKSDGALSLESLNPDYPSRLFVGDKMNDVLIYGKVIETKRKH